MEDKIIQVYWLRLLVIDINIKPKMKNLREEAG